MRTTITLTSDTTAAVRKLQREQHIGVSEAVNRLVRAGLSSGREGEGDREPFVQGTAELGVHLDVSNVAEALERLDEGETPREERE